MQSSSSSSRHIRFVSESNYVESSSSSSHASSSSSVGKGAFPSPPPPPINLCVTINICRCLLPLAKLIILAQPLDDSCSEIEREAFVALQNILIAIDNSRSDAINIFPLLEKLCRYMGVNFSEFQVKDTCLIWDLLIKLITTVIPPLREIFMGRQRLSVNDKAWENLVTRCVSAHFTSSLNSLEDFIRSTLSQVDENYYEDFDQFSHVKSTEQMLKFNASIVARAPEVLAFTIDSAHLPPTSRLFEVSGKASSKAKAPTQIKFPPSFNLSMRHDSKGTGEEDTIPNIYDLSAVVALDGSNFENVQAYYRLNQSDKTQWYRSTADENYEAVDSSRAIERNFFNANDSKKVHPRLLIYTKRGISNILDLLKEYVTRAGQLRMKGDATFAAAQTPENYDEAKQLYEDAIKYDASLRPILEERLKSLDQIEKNQRAQSYENQADLILGKKKFKEASDLYKLAIRSAVPNTSIYKRIKEKEEFMTRIISLEIANHLTEKGEECLRNGLWQQSRENFAHALKMNPSYIHLQSIIAGIDKLINAQTSHQKITEAHQCMKVGRYRQANQLFLEALQLVPEKSSTLKPLLDSLVVLMQGEDALMKQRSGLVALEDKKYQLAIQLITEAISLLPKESITEHAFFLCDRAQVYYEMKDHVTSVADCMAALELRPELSIAYLRLGSAQFEMEQFDEALVSYEKAMRYDPSMADQVRVKIRQVNTAKEIQQRKEREAERERIKEEERRRIEEKRAREEKQRKEKAEKAAQEQAERCERNLMKEEEKRMRTILQREDPLDPASSKSKSKDGAKDKAASKKDKAEKEKEKAAERERAKAEKERERERVKAEKEAKLREEQSAKEEALRKQKEFEAEVAKATAKLKEAERERELERERARVERDRLIAEREKARQEKKAAEQKKDQECAKEPEKSVDTKTAVSAAAALTTPVKAKTAAAALMQNAPSASKLPATATVARTTGDMEFPTLGSAPPSAKKEQAVAAASLSTAKKVSTPATKWASLVSSKEGGDGEGEAKSMVPSTTPVFSANVIPSILSRSATAPVAAAQGTAPIAARRTTSSSPKVDDFPPLRESSGSLASTTSHFGGVAQSMVRENESVNSSGIQTSSLADVISSSGDARKKGSSAFDTSGVVPPLSGLQATSLPFVPSSFTPSTPTAPAAPASSSSSAFATTATSTPIASTSLSFGFGMDSAAPRSTTGDVGFAAFGSGSDNLLAGLDSTGSSSFGRLFGASSSAAGTDDFSLLGNSTAYSGFSSLRLGSDPLGSSFSLGGSEPSLAFDFGRLTDSNSAASGLEGSRLMSLGIANTGASDLGGSDSLFSKLSVTGSKSPDLFGSVGKDALGLGQSLLVGLGGQPVDMSISSGLSDVSGLGLGSDGLGSGFGAGLSSLLGSSLSPLRGNSGQWAGLSTGSSSIPASTTTNSLFGSPNLNGIGSLTPNLDAGLGNGLGNSGLVAPGLSSLLPRATSGFLYPKNLRELNRLLEDERITDYTLFPAMTALHQYCGAQLYRWAFDGTEWVEFALSLPRVSEVEFRRAFEVLEKSGCEVKTTSENMESLIVLTRGATGSPSNIFMKNAMDTLVQLFPSIVNQQGNSTTVTNNTTTNNNSNNVGTGSRWASGAPSALSQVEASTASVLPDTSASTTTSSSSSFNVAPAAPESDVSNTPTRRPSSSVPPVVGSSNNNNNNTAGNYNNGHSKSSGKYASSSLSSSATSNSSNTSPLPPSQTSSSNLAALPSAAKPRPAPLKAAASSGQVKRFVEIPADMIGLVIGANGKNIKELTSESTAKVQFKTAKASEREGKPGILELHGSSDACDRALELVWNLLQTVQREYREVTAQAAAKTMR